MHITIDCFRLCRTTVASLVPERSSFSSLHIHISFSTILGAAQIHLHSFTILPSASLTVYIRNYKFRIHFPLSEFTLIQLSIPVPHVFCSKRSIQPSPTLPLIHAHRLPSPFFTRTFHLLE